MKHGLMGLIELLNNPLAVMLRPAICCEDGDESELLQQILGVGEANTQVPFEDLPEDKRQIWTDSGKKPEEYPYHKQADKPKDQVPDDPEFELEFAQGGKKEKKKLKLSELHKGYMLNEDYTRKSQEVSAEREKLKDLLEWAGGVRSNPVLSNIIMTITEKAFGKDGVNTEYLNKILPAVSEKVEEKKEELAVKNDEIESVLKDIDPESPYAKLLKNIWAANQQQLVKISELEKKMGTIEKTHTERNEAETRQAQEQAVNAAQQVLTSTLDDMLDPEKEGHFDIKSDSSKVLFRELVLGKLSKLRGDIKTKEDFVTVIKDAGKAVYQLLQKMNEDTLSGYIKTKRLPVKPDDGKPSDEVTEDLGDIGTLQKVVQDALEEAEKTNTGQ